MVELAVRWLIAPFAVVGGFVVGGGGGALFADAVGFNPDATGGASAAFAVVGMAYLVAPAKRLHCAIGVFVVGAYCAWKLLHPDPDDSGQPQTYLPLVCTYAGGVLALGISSAFHVLRAPVRRGA